jgi:hypothetical protein
MKWGLTTQLYSLSLSLCRSPMASLSQQGDLCCLIDDSLATLG